MTTGNWFDFGARRIWVVLSAALFICIVGGGYVAYRVSAERIRLDKYNELTAIGTLKTGQIVQWRQEQLNSTTKNVESPFFRNATAAWLKDSGNAVLRDEFVQCLKLEQRTQGCADALLLDPDGRILLAAQNDPGPVDAATMTAIVQAIAGKQAVLSELFRSPDGNVYIDAVAPVMDAENQPVAIVVLRSDAGKYLYPLIQTWPIPSRSAETLLVRKEGEDVLFLNELRDKTDAALSLRIPLTRSDNPEVQAVRGKEGVFAGNDYRGVKVLSYLLPISASSWFMVAKVDDNEIFTEVNYRAGVAAVFVVIFILLSAVMIAFLYRQRQVHIYRRLRRTQDSLHESEEKYRMLFDNAGDAIFIHDEEARILEVNPVACETLGYSYAELLSMTVGQVDAPEEACHATERIARLMQQGCLAFETVHRRKNGSCVPVEVSARRITWQGQPATMSICRDISKRKQAEEELERIRWMLSAGQSAAAAEGMDPAADQGYGDLAALNCDGVILRSVGKDVLGEITNEYMSLMGTSSAIYEKNGDYAYGIFSSGWCRLMDRASRDLCGTNDNATALISGKWLCHESCWTHCSKECILKGAPVDIECKGGIRLYTVPIFSGGRVVGSINFGYGDPPKDPARLRELAGLYQIEYDELLGAANAYNSRPAYIVELAKKRLFASARLIGALVERKLAELALQESSRRYRALFEQAGDGILLLDTTGKIVAVNEMFATMHGYTEEEMRRLGLEGLDVEGMAPVADRICRIMAGETLTFEVEHYHKDGHTFPIAVTSNLISSGNEQLVIAIHRDLTERKRAEAILLRTDMMLAVAQRSARAGIWDWDMASGQLTWTPEFYQLFGLDPETAATFDVWRGVTHPDDRQMAEGGIKDAIQNRLPLISEYRIILPGGDVRWINALGDTTYDERGEATRMTGICIDITERKQAEEANRHLAELLDHAPSSITVHDFDGHFVYANQRTLEMHGYSRDEFIALNLHQLDVPESKALIASRLKEISEKGEAAFEVTHFRKDGTTFPLEVYARLTRWQGRAVMLSIATDITERKQVEQEKSEEQAFSKVMIDSIPGAFYMLDEEGCYVRWNAYQRDEIVGKPEDQMAGVKAIDTIHPDDREIVGSKIENILRNGSDEIVAGRVLLRGGPEFRWLLMTGRPVIVKGRTFLLGIGIDISDQRKSEEERLKLEAQLQQAQKMESVGRLAGGVAHDFNNMLQVILGNVDLAISQSTPGSLMHESLTEIHKSAQRSADLTRQLLAFARRQTVAPKVLDLNETVTGMLKMLQRLIGENIELDWRPGENLWAVNMDPSQIDQILANLCVNARDAIADVGKLTLSTENSAFDEDYCTNHAGFAPGEYVRLAVSDSGHGMDPETLAHIFEPFFTTKGVGEGTGLGLATVYGAVKQNNGFITAYSEPGHGTTFTIYLPRHVGKAEQIRTNGATEPNARGYETILLVEDEPQVLKMTTMMLKEQGYTVLSAQTPGDAIRLAREHAGEIHLLMTDVIMPEMNGRDVARNLQSIYPNIKRLFMSGYTADIIASQNVLDKGVYFLQKPFSRKSLAVKIREVLDTE